MNRRIAKKVLKDEFEYRCPCNGPWGFHKKSTIKEAQRVMARLDRRAWLGLDRMVAPADDWLKFPQTPDDFRAAVLEGIEAHRRRELESPVHLPLIVSPEVDRLVDGFREAVARLQAGDRSIVFSGLDYGIPGATVLDLTRAEVLNTQGSVLTQEHLDYAAQKILESSGEKYLLHPDDPEILAGKPKEPEKP